MKIASTPSGNGVEAIFVRAVRSEIERDGQLRMSDASSKLVHPVVHPEFREVASPGKTDCWNPGPSDCGSGAHRSRSTPQQLNKTVNRLLTSVVPAGRIIATKTTL